MTISRRCALLLQVLLIPSVYSFELASNVGVYTGYRSDSADFSLCSTLADFNYWGYGQAKFRSINLWDIRLTGIGAVSETFYYRGMAGYARVLGGRYRDSGVFDILSDPHNSALGEYYTSCCKGGCGCSDECAPCACQCAGAGQKYHQSVPSKGCLTGSAFDLSLALGHMFHSSDTLGWAPVIGWAFNQQRYKTLSTMWGPIPLTYFPSSTCIATESGMPFYEDNAILVGGLAPTTGMLVAFDTPNSATFTVDSTASEVNQVTVEGVGQRLLEPGLGCGPTCVRFGACGDNSSYRARWNGPFIGLDLLWDFAEGFRLQMAYELHYQRLSGRFDSMGGGGCCEQVCQCDSCPSFQKMLRGPGESRDYQNIEGCNSFCPQTITWHSRGWGQVVDASLAYQCGQNWLVGCALSYSMASASKCRAIDQCSSCCSVINPTARSRFDPDPQPYWKDARFRQAKWQSIVASLGLAYQF